MPSAPDKAKVQVVETASCKEVLAILNGQGKAAAAAPANGCTADCRTCVGDGNSRWAAGGGTNGIPCDPCCCAPGGPAPLWRTP